MMTSVVSESQMYYVFSSLSSIQLDSQSGVDKDDNQNLDYASIDFPFGFVYYG